MYVFSGGQIGSWVKSEPAFLSQRYKSEEDVWETLPGMRSPVCVLYVSVFLPFGESGRTEARPQHQPLSSGLIWKKKDHVENIWQSGNLIPNQGSSLLIAVRQGTSPWPPWDGRKYTCMHTHTHTPSTDAHNRIGLANVSLLNIFQAPPE